MCVKEGDIVVNKNIADKIRKIFYELFKFKYKIEMINCFGYENNNTCAFWKRENNASSLHNLGYAIDINPLYNPYISYENGEILVIPPNGIEFIDRSNKREHMIDEDDLCYSLFINEGFRWGGTYKNIKDYMHFEYTEQ